ncbi:IclR family transcriptional regulator [Aquabacter sp. L1I39]|nr:IclR family transcriptional regulator [Aquabacter sp. L1I39]
MVGRAGTAGARLSDLVVQSRLPKPTARRVLLALVRSGLLDQDEVSRRYHIGPEAFILGTLASARFGIHALSLDGLARLARETGDTVFLSVPRDTYSVCLHREEGPFPLRTHVLQAGDRHPLGVGAGSLALLSSLPDAEVERIIVTNGEVLAQHYPAYSPERLRALVADTRLRGYAFNPGLVMAGSWGVGVAVVGADGRAVGALSIAAVESRLPESRHSELIPLLKRESALLTQSLSHPTAAPQGSPSRSTPLPRTGRQAPRPLQKVRP